MSPLPTPEERRKRLKSLSLDEVLGRGRKAGRGFSEAQHRRSAAAEERDRQRREASRRAGSTSRG